MHEQKEKTKTTPSQPSILASSLKGSPKLPYDSPQWVTCTGKGVSFLSAHFMPFSAYSDSC